MKLEQLRQSGLIMHRDAFRFLLAVLVVCCLAGCTAPFREDNLVQPINALADKASREIRTSENLRVMTLNIAHGRKDGGNQILQKNRGIRSNLDDAVRLLHRIEADVVALQEADGPSSWSGGFDHVAYLAERGGYPWFFRGSHVKNNMLDYGTALLSRGEITWARSHPFEPSPPTLNKGFVVGQIMWRPSRSPSPMAIDVVSLHLDFARKKIRERQVREMESVLAWRNNPLIILGDFNSDWFARDSVIKRFVERNGLRAFRPETEGYSTFARTGKRIDWILISPELTFRKYRTLPDVVSDHAAVVAEIGKSESQLQPGNIPVKSAAKASLTAL